MEIKLEFYDHEVVQRARQDYEEIIISPQLLLREWSQSLFSHEILNKDGSVKSLEQMNPPVLEKYIEISDLIKHHQKIAKPVIGIGIMDTIEIGIGREIIAAVSMMGISSIPVHMRKAQAKDIKKMLKV